MVDLRKGKILELRYSFWCGRGRQSKSGIGLEIDFLEKYQKVLFRDINDFF